MVSAFRGRVNKNLKSKVILGSASWGARYGLLNSSVPGVETVAEIIRLSQGSGINSVDTSPDYGTSEELIGLATPSSMDIYSKISENTWNQGTRQTVNRLQKSLSELGCSSLKGLMFHSTAPLLENPKLAQSFMEKLVDKGLISKWGVSVYEIDEAEKVLEKSNPDFVQFPSSIADTRFVDARMLPRLKERGVEAIARSIFLQGLLLKKSSELPETFKSASNWLDKVRALGESHGLSIFQLALSYGLNLEVDRIIVGVNSTQHTIDLIRTIEKLKSDVDFEKLPRLEEPSLIDPRSWKQ